MSGHETPDKLRDSFAEGALHASGPDEALTNLVSCILAVRVCRIIDEATTDFGSDVIAAFEKAGFEDHQLLVELFAERDPTFWKNLARGITANIHPRNRNITVAVDNVEVLEQLKSGDVIYQRSPRPPQTTTQIA